MTIGELREVIKDLPDDMPFALIDLSTDNYTDCNYPLSKASFEIMDYMEEEDGEPVGKALFIVFENKLNEDPI